MPSYPRSPIGYIPPHDILNPTKIIITILAFENEDHKS
jgi:hypothetical protein